MLARLDELTEQLAKEYGFGGAKDCVREEENQSEIASLEYLFYKMQYSKAKVLRKMR